MNGNWCCCYNINVVVERYGKIREMEWFGNYRHGIEIKFSKFWSFGLWETKRKSKREHKRYAWFLTLRYAWKASSYWSYKYTNTFTLINTVIAIENHKVTFFVLLWPWWLRLTLFHPPQAAVGTKILPRRTSFRYRGRWWMLRIFVQYLEWSMHGVAVVTALL